MQIQHYLCQAEALFHHLKPTLANHLTHLLTLAANNLRLIQTILAPTPVTHHSLILILTPQIRILPHLP